VNTKETAEEGARPDGVDFGFAGAFGTVSGRKGELIELIGLWGNI
jgi:hypothetical protein